jgi:hypothetical protein
MLKDIGKVQNNHFWNNEGCQKNIMDAKNVDVLVGEN